MKNRDKQDREKMNKQNSRVDELMKDKSFGTRVDPEKSIDDTSVDVAAGAVDTTGRTTKLKTYNDDFKMNGELRGVRVIQDTDDEGVARDVVGNLGKVEGDAQLVNDWNKKVFADMRKQSDENKVEDEKLIQNNQTGFRDSTNVSSIWQNSNNEQLAFRGGSTQASAHEGIMSTNGVTTGNWTGSQTGFNGNEAVEVVSGWSKDKYNELQKELAQNQGSTRNQTYHYGAIQRPNHDFNTTISQSEAVAGISGSIDAANAIIEEDNHNERMDQQRKETQEWKANYTSGPREKDFVPNANTSIGVPTPEMKGQTTGAKGDTIEVPKEPEKNTSNPNQVSGDDIVLSREGSNVVKNKMSPVSGSKGHDSQTIATEEHPEWYTNVGYDDRKNKNGEWVKMGDGGPAKGYKVAMFSEQKPETKSEPGKNSSFQSNPVADVNTVLANATQPVNYGDGTLVPLIQALQDRDNARKLSKSNRGTVSRDASQNQADKPKVHARWQPVDVPGFAQSDFAKQKTAEYQRKQLMDTLVQSPEVEKKAIDFVPDTEK